MILPPLSLAKKKSANEMLADFFLSSMKLILIFFAIELIAIKDQSGVKVTAFTLGLVKDDVAHFGPDPAIAVENDLSWSAGSCGICSASSSTGILTAPLILPSLNSSGFRTSMNSLEPSIARLAFLNSSIDIVPDLGIGT